MTYEFAYLMHLLGAAARGTSADPPVQTPDWDKVLELAREQQLIPLVNCAFRISPDLGCPKEIAGKYFKGVLQNVLTDCARRGSVAALLEEMEQEGIHAAVVKGFAAARQYAFPENRISSDTDILVSPDDEERTCEFLRRHGFTVSQRWENGHHAAARHPEMGIVEVHVRLYDEIVEDVWFKNADTTSFITEPQIRITTDDGCYYTLGLTDHLIFMILHMIKHFILCGMSLRMMMDTALFYAAHREVLDLPRLWSILNDLQYGTLMNTILGAMIIYCGFRKDEFPGIGTPDEENIDLLLQDLEEGGWLGQKYHAERKEGWYEYNRQIMLKETSQWKYRLYMLNWQHKFSIRTLFPDRKRLSVQYPYIIRYPWLIPYAWLHRILFRGCSLLRRKTWTRAIADDNNKLNAKGAARVSMFRQLGMLQ